MKTLILGASSEVGRELAYLFAAEGQALVLTSRNIHQLEPLRADLEIRFSASVELLELDSGFSISQQEIFSKVIEKINCVICLWGYLGNQSLAEKQEAERTKIMEANYIGPVRVLEKVAAVFSARGKGTIVGVSSVAGLRGRKSNYWYGSAKAGFIAYLSGLRQRLSGEDLLVLTVLPGYLDTKMTADLDLPKLLTASPEQAAKAIHRAIGKKRTVIYIYPVWRYIMWVIRSIPEFIFKRLNL